MPLLKLSQLDSEDVFQNIDEKFGEDRSNIGSSSALAEEESFKSSNITESSGNDKNNGAGLPDIKKNMRSMSVTGNDNNEEF